MTTHRDEQRALLLDVLLLRAMQRMAYAEFLRLIERRAS